MLHRILKSRVICRILPLDISIETRTIIISHEGVYFGKLVACIHLDGQGRSKCRVSVWRPYPWKGIRQDEPALRAARFLMKGRISGREGILSGTAFFFAGNSFMSLLAD